MGSLALSPDRDIRLTRADRGVLGLAFIVLLMVYWQLWGPGVLGNQVSVLVGGKHWESFDLYTRQTVIVPGALGDSHLQIEDGKVRFIQSPCSGKQCIHQGWVKQSGEFAACLPNRVSVQILGVDPQYDSINF